MTTPCLKETVWAALCVCFAHIVVFHPGEQANALLQAAWTSPSPCADPQSSLRLHAAAGCGRQGLDLSAPAALACLQDLWPTAHWRQVHTAWLDTCCCRQPNMLCSCM